MNQPLVSIIIVTWNSGDHIGPCLDSVFAQAPAGLAVTVVDNASTDHTLGVIRSRAPGAVVMENRRNLGYAAAVNQGLSQASGDHILLLNPDTVLQPGALAAMLSFMEAEPRAGVLGPQLLHPDGRLQPSCREFPRPVHFLWEFTGLARAFPRHRTFGSWRMGYFDHLRRREVDQPMGACLLVRRTAAQQAGPMDAENYPMFFNEVDWCLRIKRLGWRIYFLPEAKVFHHHGASTRKARRAMLVSSHRSLSRFLAAHYPGRPSVRLIIALLHLLLPLRLMWSRPSPRQ